MTVSIFIMPVKLELPTIKILTSISLTLSDYKTETRNQVSILKQLLAFWHSVLFLLIGWIWTWHLTAKNLNSRNEETSQSIWGLILPPVNKVNLVKIFSSICWSVNLGALVRRRRRSAGLDIWDLCFSKWASFLPPKTVLYFSFLWTGHF